jgi:hypothetical protein
VQELIKAVRQLKSLCYDLNYPLLEGKLWVAEHILQEVEAELLSMGVDTTDSEGYGRNTHEREE